MDVGARAGLLRHFRKLKDPRVDRSKRHSLNDILTIAICAVICGADGWAQVELFGKSKLKWFRTFLDLPHGIPSHDTFGRVFARLDPRQFEQCFLNWINALADKPLGRLVAIDGKTLRGSFDRVAEKSAIHMVSAWCEHNQTVLGQVVTDAKSNEITAIPQLLDMLDLDGAVVTTDAMGCQKAIAKKAIACGADYILQVKGNHPKLEKELKLLFDECRRKDAYAVAHDYTEQTDKGHGRIETRRCWMTTDVGWLPDGAEWENLGSFACVESTRQIGEKIESDQRYYISSVEKRDAARMLQRVRGHWGVENRLHWRLDVVFDEDRRRVRSGHAAENFSRLSRIALNLLKSESSKKAGIKSKRLCCGWDHGYLLKVLAQGN